MDFQQSQCKKVLKLWLDFSEEKSLQQRMDFQQSQCQKRVETMTRFGKGKQFETTDGFPTISVQTSVETMARFVKKQKSLKQRMDLQTIPSAKKCNETMA